MSGTLFRHSQRVSYSLCTVGNHVYYSRYLDILEVARNEFFREAGASLLDLQQADTIFPVIGVALNYKAPARYDDVVTTELWLSELAGIRLTFGSRILNQAGVVLVDGETRHACANLAERPKRIPKEIIEKLQRFCVV